MSIPVSIVPQAQANLLTAIQAQVRLDPLYNEMLVRIGEQGPALPNDAILILGVRRTTNVETFIGSGGTDWLNEKFDIAVDVMSWIGSGDSDGTSTVAEQVLDRAWQLVGYVETAVRSDPSLAGIANIAYPSSAIQAGPEWTSDPVGLRCVVTVVVHVEDLN